MECKGLIFRGYRRNTSYKNRYEFHQGLRLLKRMSCDCAVCRDQLAMLQDAMKGGKLFKLAIPDLSDGRYYKLWVEDYNVTVYPIPEPPRTCSKGHPRTPENTSKDGSCRTCGLEKMRKRRATNKAAINESQRKSYWKSRDGLSDSYLNRLVYLKTGLKAHEITDTDREARRQSVLAYRMKRARNQGLTTAGI